MVEHLTADQEVPGSNPGAPYHFSISSTLLTGLTGTAEAPVWIPVRWAGPRRREEDGKWP